MQALVVVDVAGQFQLLAVRQHPGQFAPGLAGTVDQRLGQTAARRHILVQTTQPIARQRPRSAHRHPQQQGLDDAHTARHPGQPQHRDHTGVQHGIKRKHAQQRLRCRPIGVAENDAVKAIDHKQRERNGQRRQRRQIGAVQIVSRTLPRQPKVEPQIKRQPHREHAQRPIHHQRQRALERARQRQYGLRCTHQV